MFTCVVDKGGPVAPLVGPLRPPSPPALSRWPRSLQNAGQWAVCAAGPQEVEGRAAPNMVSYS